MKDIERNSLTSKAFRSILYITLFICSGTVFWIMWYGWTPFKELSSVLGFWTAAGLGLIIIVIKEKSKAKRINSKREINNGKITK